MNAIRRRGMMCVFLTSLCVSVVLTGCPGPTEVTVPGLFEMTHAGANTALGLVGLTPGTVTDIHSETVAAGAVVSQNPLAGTTVAPGTPVDIVLSLGPAVNDNVMTVMLPGDVPLRLAKIPAGSFTMGSPTIEIDRMFDESPRRLVTFNEPFWMGQTEVTQEQWQALMGSTPWLKRDGVLEDPASPATYVSWNDAQDFAAELSAHTGQTFRLPSESEWEYAARAGIRDRFYWGMDPDITLIVGFAWWSGNARLAGKPYAHPAGLLRPNKWNLYDMAGNVSEWVRDWYHVSYDGAPTDGSAWEIPAGNFRVRRGGHWDSPGGELRSAQRDFGLPTTANDVTGFRIAH